ncbi:DUF4238 domain-containing protein [Sphingobium sp. R-21]|uniref:DUF4238 domain-containing protein n=1 Tax=Sphingobium sp. R-21 TaxID=3404056 RepID=UPI003CF9AD55
MSQPDDWRTAVRYRPTMSGSKQHFIPQSLLKGFGVKRGKSTFVVAYTHDRGIFTPATDGIAAERHFYSELGVEGGDETLDDRITDHETPLATMLSKLRSLSDGARADPGEAAAFVTHLAVRNDHFRKAVTSAGARIMDLVADQFADADSSRALLGLDDDDPRGLFAEQLKEAFDQYRPLIDMLGMDRETFDRWAFENVKSNFATMHEEISGSMSEVVMAISEALPGTAADAQRRALNEDLVPAKRVEALSALAWRVTHPSEPLILPDCVGVGFDKNGKGLPLMMIDREDLYSIVMPIASDRLLVGMVDETAKLPGGLNETMASCSWDFYVARDRTDEFEKLRGALRSLIAPYIDEIVDGAADGALRDLND